MNPRWTSIQYGTHERSGLALVIGNGAYPAPAELPNPVRDAEAMAAALERTGFGVTLLACRDNPFAGQTGGRGLAPMDAQPGTFLAYATAPGHVALDGREGGNSLYTGALVRELARPQKV